jgi:hypothetical protein
MTPDKPKLTNARLAACIGAGLVVIAAILGAMALAASRNQSPAETAPAAEAHP